MNLGRFVHPMVLQKRYAGIVNKSTIGVPYINDDNWSINQDNHSINDDNRSMSDNNRRMYDDNRDLNER